MEEVKGYFIGYKEFTASKTGKQYMVLSFLFLTDDTVNSRVTYFVKDLFVKESDYVDFLKSNSIMDLIVLKREIVDDTVRYYIN